MAYFESDMAKKKRLKGPMVQNTMYDDQFQETDITIVRFSMSSLLFPKKSNLKEKKNDNKRHNCPNNYTYINVLGDRNFTGSKTLEEGRLARSIGTDESIATPKIEINIRVGNQLATVETERKRLDLDIARERLGGQDSGRGTVTAFALGNLHSVEAGNEDIGVIGRGLWRSGGVAAICGGG